MAEAVRKAGDWVVCRPGCCACCMGPFPVSPLDAERLRAGFVELASLDPERASAVKDRARQWGGADDEACPALDPSTGTCDLYAARPLTCRTFGPPVRCDSGAVAICELCFVGASDEEIAAAAVELDITALDPSDDGDEVTVAMVLMGE